MQRRGDKLRVALTATGVAEPFMIRARYQIKSRMHVYGEAETRHAVNEALRATGSTCEQFLEDATNTGRHRGQREAPPPTVWDEPALVIGGVAPGTLADWREHRRTGGRDEAGTR